MLFPSHSLPLLSDFLPSLSFPFPSDPLWEEAELWSTRKGAGEWESCKEGGTLGLVTEVGKRAKVPLKSPWRLVFLSLLGDSWSWGYFRLLLIGLLVYKALSHTLLHSIFTITAGQLLFSSFYRWTKWSSQWLRNEPTNWIRGKIWTSTLISFLRWCSFTILTPAPENNDRIGNTTMVHSSWGAHYMNFFLKALPMSPAKPYPWRLE